MDSMTEMFYDESSGILHNLRKSLHVSREYGEYDQDMVQEIFRGVHTLKADSTMMLYENMAELSRELEGLLYCFREDGKKITDVERFSDVVLRYLDFVEEETDKLVQGRVPNGKDDALLEEIRQYVSEEKAQMEEDEIVKYHSAVNSSSRQVYYISGASDVVEEVGRDSVSDENEITKEDITSQPYESVSDVGSGQSGQTIREGKKYTLSETERQEVYQASYGLQRVVDRMESTFMGDVATITREQLEKLREVQSQLEHVKNCLSNTDFVPVAKKMEIVVDEMSAKLGKPAKLLVKGEKTLVDAQTREKISGALIHVIRNAMDHGIEDMDTRERYGKSPMALIKLKFKTEDGYLKISVRDDGCGIDTQKILQKAQDLNLLKKPPEKYTEKEVYNLLLINGMTTREDVSDYSGRGVGMDVIYHNITELGGKLKISSKVGEGTTISMKI